MAQKSEAPVPPIAGMMVGVLAASTASIFIRYAQAYAPSLVIAAYRLTFASLILIPILFLWGRETLQKLDRKDIGRVLLAGFFLALHFATWISSLAYTTVASSVVLVATSPLFVALLSPLVLGESLNRELKYGLLLSLMGSILVGLGDACTINGALQCPPVSQFVQGKAIQGDLLALCGAVAGAGYMITGRGLRSHVPLLPYISLVYGTAAAVLIGIALGTGGQPFGYPPRAYLWFLLLALLPQLIAHSTINWALRYLTAAYVSITLLGEPVASTIWAYFLLDELPGALTLLGGLLILAGIGVASRRPSPALV